MKQLLLSIVLVVGVLLCTTTHVLANDIGFAECMIVAQQCSYDAILTSNLVTTCLTGPGTLAGCVAGTHEYCVWPTTVTLRYCVESQAPLWCFRPKQTDGSVTEPVNCGVKKRAHCFMALVYPEINWFDPIWVGSMTETIAIARIAAGDTDIYCPDNSYNLTCPAPVPLDPAHLFIDGDSTSCTSVSDYLCAIANQHAAATPTQWCAYSDENGVSVGLCMVYECADAPAKEEERSIGANQISPPVDGSGGVGAAR